MAGLKGLYDPNDKAEDFDVLPAGQYAVKVTAGEMKRTKKGTGEFLQIEMTVVEGQHQGRKIFDRFNLVNPNAEAVKIARGQFAALREAVGVLDPNDPADLMGPRFQLVLKCAKRRERLPDGTYRELDEMENVIGRYIKRGQTAATPQQYGEVAPWSRNTPKSDSTPPAAPAGREAPPW